MRDFSFYISSTCRNTYHIVSKLGSHLSSFITTEDLDWIYTIYQKQTLFHPLFDLYLVTASFRWYKWILDLCIKASICTVCHWTYDVTRHLSHTRMNLTWRHNTIPSDRQEVSLCCSLHTKSHAVTEPSLYMLG